MSSVQVDMVARINSDLELCGTRSADFTVSAEKASGVWEVPQRQNIACETIRARTSTTGEPNAGECPACLCPSLLVNTPYRYVRGRYDVRSKCYPRLPVEVMIFARLKLSKNVLSNNVLGTSRLYVRAVQ
eukprot:scaffold124883_cov36-Attheya_sp.AAC.3